VRKPSIGDTVHYVSYGTPGGEYTKECRAAIITEVSGHAISPVTGEDVDEWVAGLCVLNPTGQFFNRSVVQDDGRAQGAPSNLCTAREHRGGSWHWPEHTEEEQA
jgi:hypothetical protein